MGKVKRVRVRILWVPRDKCNCKQTARNQLKGKIEEKQENTMEKEDGQC